MFAYDSAGILQKPDFCSDKDGWTQRIKQSGYRHDHSIRLDRAHHKPPGSGQSPTLSERCRGHRET